MPTSHTYSTLRKRLKSLEEQHGKIVKDKSAKYFGLRGDLSSNSALLLHNLSPVVAFCFTIVTNIAWRSVRPSEDHSMGSVLVFLPPSMYMLILHQISSSVSDSESSSLKLHKAIILFNIFLGAVFEFEFGKQQILEIFLVLVFQLVFTGTLDS